jgi:hypothetical protein
MAVLIIVVYSFTVKVKDLSVNCELIVKANKLNHKWVCLEILLREMSGLKTDKKVGY